MVYAHITFLNNDQVENAEVGVNDAPTDRLAFAFAGPAGTVAGVALAEEQAHAAMGQHTLLHGEALPVVAPADAHNVTLQKYRKNSVLVLCSSIQRYFVCNPKNNEDYLIVDLTN